MLPALLTALNARELQPLCMTVTVRSLHVLLAFGADIRFVSPACLHTGTPVAAALYRGAEDAFIEELLRRGADTDTVAPSGYSTLLRAIYMKRANLLLDYGADPRVRTSAGKHALHIALQFGCNRTCDRILHDLSVAKYNLDRKLPSMLWWCQSLWELSDYVNAEDGGSSPTSVLQTAQRQRQRPGSVPTTYPDQLLRLGADPARGTTKAVCKRKDATAAH